MEELIQSLKVNLASHFAFYLKTHYYHWNIGGPDFFQYHNLLQEIYEEVYGVVDQLAEEIRALDAYAPGGFTRYSQLTLIKDDETVPPAMVMISNLLADIATMQSSIKTVYDLAEQNGMHNLSNLMAERQDAFNKHAWFLKSTLKVT
jgi:starvation-inducible DNA-binding protein